MKEQIKDKPGGIVVKIEWEVPVDKQEEFWGLIGLIKKLLYEGNSEKFGRFCGCKPGDGFCPDCGKQMLPF